MENLSHCCYMISNNGTSWTHTPENNRKEQPITFDKHDTIYLEYDPVASVIRFRKNEDGERFEMRVQKAPKHDEYRPIVLMNCEKEAVTIMDGERLS